MREIKFRCYMNDSNPRMISWEEIVKENWHIGRIQYGSPDVYKWMQYTELKDENGKEIYEDDIAEGFLNWDNQSRYIVCGKIYFRNGHFCLGETYLSKLDNKKIIGNIYENPELINLKGE